VNYVENIKFWFMCK